MLTSLKNAVKRLNIFSKLVLSFMIVIIPLATLSLLMNQSGENIVRNELGQSNASNVHFYLSSLETEMNRIIRVEREYTGTDDDFRRAGVIPESMDDYERAQTILRIENKLSILQSSSPYISTIKIYFPKLGRSILSGSFGEAIPSDELDAIAGGVKRSGSPFIYWNNRLFLGMVYPATGPSMSFAIEVELSLPLLRQSLAQMSKQASSGSILMNEREGWVVSDKKEDALTGQLRRFMAQTPSGDMAFGQQRLKLNDQPYLLYYERSAALGLTLIHYVPERQAMGVLKQYRTWYWTLALGSVIVVILFSYWIYLLIHQPMKGLIKGLRQVGRGNLSVRLQHGFQDEFQDIYHQFNSMAGRIQTLIDEVLEQTTRSQRSELKQLQSQINPHFLYNSMFILLTLIKREDLRHAEELIKHMGNYFRYITRNGEDEVALEKEILHVQAYMGIQSVRFPAIEMTWREFPDAALKMKVPRLMLQPIIENAYVHGLERKEDPGVLVIEAWQADGRLTIGVEDNGDNLDDSTIRELSERLRSNEESQETTGLINVHRRLQLKYGKQYGLSLSRGSLGGMQVMLHLPFGGEPE
ncbi:two-component system, sensor histidine kinase YesM [Cohnella sp. OV330]|uniref:sensor histidine kinase n=1 Tax=Cohnella sp. OV330 TaxID=1855288 RepID=UPI0008F366C5|nr:sensor histidine kinase [Cohnella sp. OV330]SFA79813.1 two-component system, sensor histidine kinase YesM [Cohnella sp. OV330]